MSFLGGLNPANLVTSTLLAAATGGTSLVAQLGARLLSSVGQNIIQQLGQKLGLPQSAIDFAQAAYCGATGDARGAARNYQEGVSEFVQAAGGSFGDQNSLSELINDVTKGIVKQAKDAYDASEAEGGGDGKDSFLVAFAKALAKVMDGKMQRMMELSGQMDQQIKSANASKEAPAISQMSAEVSALGQEVNMISQALNNSVKSLGEAASTLARKG